MEQEGTSLMEPTGAAPLRPTDLREIGPYRLLGRLGEGGMGTVFLARAPTGRFVALKVVKAEFANQEGFAARFHAEVENARRVASFCTAQVLDNGNTGDGRPYMVTEYIAGTPLSDQISTYGALDPGPLHGVALGVAAALAAIHVAGLVHRDLKPANVILSLSGPRVIDFGIARALDRETGFTMSGELLGSPGWWAPEQVRGEVVSPAADIFAWGCLVAYAGNGRHPFGRGDPITLATRVLNTPPELGALPAPLNELVRRATTMDPAVRPTAQDLLIALVGGSTPSTAVAADVNPPTLVANEMLSEWQPPQNVVDEPDITATFTTPPPSDTTGRSPVAPPPTAGGGTPGVAGAGPAGTATGGAGSAGDMGSAGATGPAGTGPAGAGPAGAGSAGVARAGAVGGTVSGETAGVPSPSVEELARREEAAARAELAQWEVRSPEQAPARLRGLFRSRGKQAGQEEQQRPAEVGPGGGLGADTQPGGRTATPGGGQTAAPKAQTAAPKAQSTAPKAQSTAPKAQTARADAQTAGRQGPTAGADARTAAPAAGSGAPPAGPGAPSARPSAPPAGFGAQAAGPDVRTAGPGAPAAGGGVRTAGAGAPVGTVDDADTLGGTRTAGTRWLIAAVAAVLAIVVTAAVLIVTSGRGTGPAASPSARSQATASARSNDVGRRFALGAGFDDPIAIVSAAPECGLKEFEGKTSAEGQLCVIRWTMLNPSGERRLLIQPVVTMVDDRGGEHDAVPVTLPPAILPGARVDGTFVFDLATYRKPVKMTANMLDNGKQIEVAL